MTAHAPFVLTGGSVIDGSGAAAFNGDVVVTDGVVELAPPHTVRDMRTVDVSGLVVAPGFIDTHSHADVANLLGDAAIDEARVAQGVTTEVVGNCGLSSFPVPVGSGDMARQFMGIVFGPDADSYADIDAYAQVVSEAGLPSNVAPLVGHGTLRATVLGYEDRPASADELAAMNAALDSAMASGAFGFSTGLCYTPATYAPTEEIRALARTVSRHGGIYATHIRNETDLTVASLEEAIDVSEVTRVDLHISHLKAAGREQWGSSGEILTLLEQARGRGISVTADVYPYTAASTALHSLLPPWTAEGGLTILARNLPDPDWRDRVDHDLRDGVAGWQNLGSAAGWHNVFIATSEANPVWEGLSIADLGEAGERPIDTIARVLSVNDCKVVVVIESMDPDDVAAFLAWPHAVVGSDGIPLPGNPHPRLTGTFPRVLHRYRDGLGSLEAAVHRMTGASAERFSIPQRGTVSNGDIADLVVFDPDTICDRGTYEDPWPQPIGIHHVFIAGRQVVRDGIVVDRSAGSVLRRG